MPTLAADPYAAHNAIIAAKEAELEKKYGIDILYPSVSKNGNAFAGIYLQSLTTLDTALGYVTPSVVRQVSDYYRQLNGTRLTVSYVYGETQGKANEGAFTRALFEDKTSLIEIYIPRRGSSSEGSGDNPLSIIHEFAHALHIMCNTQYGEDQMARQWIAYNGQYAYDEGNIIRNPNKKIFVSGYAATSFMEDFAETFAYAYVCNRNGLGIAQHLASGSQKTALGKKISRIEQMIPQYLNDTDASIANLRNLYTASAAITYNKARLSGLYLQLTGYDEPGNLPRITLSQIGIDPEACEWVTEIGGWTVQTNKGPIVIFSDGIVRQA